MLLQTDVGFHLQKKFKWSEGKTYDVQIGKYLIEIHGRQHYEDGTKRGRSFKEEKKNDKRKRELAEENHFRYIEIDARYSKIDYLKSSIMNSELASIVNLSNVDWCECHRFASKSLCVEAWRLWDSGIKSAIEIAKILNIGYATSTRYLKSGAEAGMCTYTVLDARKEIWKKSAVKHLKPVVQLSLDGNFIAKYDGMVQAVSKLQLHEKAYLGISLVCKGKRNIAYGYRWVFLEDWETRLGQ